MTIALMDLQPFPINLPNALWFVLSAILLMTYLSTYVVQSTTIFGKFTKYLVEYGKYKSYSSVTDVPKRFFSHYYIVASTWNTFCLINVIGLCFYGFEKNFIASIFLLQESPEPKGDQLSAIIVMTLLTIQSYRRLHECLFVSVYSSKSRITIVQYLWGFTYYLLLAPTLISEILPLNKLSFGQFHIRHAVGIFGFLIASFFHHQSHVILANLRKKKKVKNDSHGIPEGGLFTYISCPHYFAELLIYLSLWIIIYPQCTSWWLVFLYNFVAHVNMAVGAHLWYKETFPSYPKSRKALIPFVY